MYVFVAFIGISFIVIVTPGPDTATTIRNTLLGGRASGIFTAFGVAVGQMIWAFSTSAGIVALLIASEPVFVAVKYIGAVYLIYLGGQALRKSVRPSAQQDAIKTEHGRRSLTRLRAFRQGLVSDLANPKMAVFFASLLPQFVPAGGASFSALLIHGCLFALMTLAWLALYAAVVARIGDFLRRGRIRRAVEGLTGAVLIGLGLRMAVEHR